MICRECVRVNVSMTTVFQDEPELRDLYYRILKYDHERRQAFIVGCHGFLLDDHMVCHIKIQLRALRSECNANAVASKRQTDLVSLFSEMNKQPKVLGSSIIDGPAVHRNETGTDMNPVATIMQDQPHYYVARYNTSLLLGIPRCVPSAPCRSLPAWFNLLRYAYVSSAHHTPHMWPGGIQDVDESSKDKPKEVSKPKRFTSSRAMYQKMWRLNKSGYRAPSENKQAVLMRRRRAGLLSTTRRRQLDRVLFTIYKETAWMKGVLLKATNSMQVDSSFLSKVQALCDTLVEDVAVEIVKYTEKNKEADTVKLKQRALMHLDEARQQFKYLQRIVCL